MADKLLNDFEDRIENLCLIPSDGGVFEVTVDGSLVYSKRKTGRHASYEEVHDAVARKG
ncbi:MAG TPA: hypothetical protein DEP84_15040 [Chloroflexi bacterium]|nr:hypothetical protein [Chloroflexota bacterium]